MLYKLERRPWHADGVKRFERIEKSLFEETYKKAIMSDRDLPACSSKDRAAVICHHFPSSIYTEHPENIQSSYLNSIGFGLLKMCKMEVIIYVGTT